MNIGIDIDGVLTDLQGFHRKHAPPFFWNNFKLKLVDETSCDIRDMFKCSRTEWYAYWKKYLLKYSICEPARKEAKRVLHKLFDDGHNMFIVTKRVFTCQDDFMGKLMRLIVRNWLWRNKIKHNGIVFCLENIADSKRTACEENNIDIMIDDELVNIAAIAPIAKVICFDTSYNQGCEGDNIVRARNWDEVYALIAENANLVSPGKFR